MNTIRHIVLAAATVLTLASPAFAYDRSFEVSNSGHSDIMFIYATDVGRGGWGYDLLGDYTISPGDSEWVEPNTANRGCMFDVKIVFDDGRRVVINDADLCSVVEIRTNGSTYRLFY